MPARGFRTAPNNRQTERLSMHLLALPLLGSVIYIGGGLGLVLVIVIVVLLVLINIVGDEVTSLISNRFAGVQSETPHVVTYDYRHRHTARCLRFG